VSRGWRCSTTLTFRAGDHLEQRPRTLIFQRLSNTYTGAPVTIAFAQPRASTEPRGHAGSGNVRGISPSTLDGDDDTNQGQNRRHERFTINGVGGCSPLSARTRLARPSSTPRRHANPDRHHGPLFWILTDLPASHRDQQQPRIPPDGLRHRDQLRARPHQRHHRGRFGPWIR